MQIYGKGDQTRSFQYVSDLVDGLVALMHSNYTKPVNLGSPDEHEIKGKYLCNVFEQTTEVGGRSSTWHS